MKKGIRLIALLLAATAISVCGCSKQGGDDADTSKNTNAVSTAKPGEADTAEPGTSDNGGKDTMENVKYKETEEMTDYVKIEMEDGGVIIIKLSPEDAPITVANFKKLVSEKFYDGIIFHRVIAGLIIQGGDPQGTGYGGSSETIKGEFSSNGVNNTLKHVRGTISMARTNAPDSASSQFFICCTTVSQWDGSYAAFGSVISGMDVVDKISNAAANRNDKPLEDQKMKTVRFVTIEEN